MTSPSRRQFFRSTALAFVSAGTLVAREMSARASAVVADGASASPVCLVELSELGCESHDTPFFEHFHTLAIPVSALANAAAGQATLVTLKTSPIDLGSYDIAGLRTFAASSGLDQQALLTHSHDVTISSEQLARIAGGEKDVELRVISKNGNYVHNFLVSATPSTLVKVRKLARRG